METTQNTGADVLRNDFAALLPQLNKGRVAPRVSEKLDQVIRGVLASGLKGTVTLTISVTPTHKDENGDIDQVDLSAAVKAKVPESALPSTLFYIGKNNDLHRHNPMQATLEMAGAR